MILWRVHLLKYLFTDLKTLIEYIKFKRKRDNDISIRKNGLARYIKNLGDECSITLIARSLGGIIATQLAQSENIEKIICIGYPFKNPSRGIESYRFEHLKYLKTPCLIIQGEQDEYGGLEVTKNYDLSDHIKICFVKANHDFLLSDEDYNKVINKIEKFIA